LQGHYGGMDEGVSSVRRPALGEMPEGGLVRLVLPHRYERLL
jgi:hypothetical protein